MRKKMQVDHKIEKQWKTESGLNAVCLVDRCSMSNETGGETCSEYLRRTVLDNDWIPHTPTPKQAVFLCLPTTEAFFGGAAGGGKSDVLLMAALQFVDVPGYASILFRCSYTDPFRCSYTDLTFPGALMDRAREWLDGTSAQWIASEKTWRFPGGGTLTFGYLETEADKWQYQSAEFQFIGFDELTQFSENQYRFLFSRLRRLKDANVPVRMRSASNLVGPGHDWVKERFIEPASPERIFIPARLQDNPYLDQKSYIELLNKLDPVTREQLLNGDWSARQTGTLFKREWFPLVDTAPECCEVVRFWDMAATDPKRGADPDWTVGCKVGRDRDRFYVLDVRRMRGEPQETERLIRQTAKEDGKAVRIYMEEEGGSGKTVTRYYATKVLPGWTFEGVRPTGRRVARANPVSSQAHAGNITLVRGSWLQAFIDELEAFPHGAHDDQVDALSGAMEQLMMEQTIPPVILV